jgi:F-type H+-transporting ATPase subunit delta
MPPQASDPQRKRNLDPTRQQLGGIYAKALLGATEKVGQSEAVLAELDSFITDVLDKHPQFEQLLGSAIVSAEDKEQILERTIGHQASPLVSNFLKVLARHGRLDFVRAICSVAHDQLNDLRGRVRVDVITASPLNDTLTNQLTDRLRHMLGSEPALTPQIDPDVIGGLILRVGDTVYDASLATQLNRLSGQIINRSVHEIQSRRDRFSYSTGN